MNLLTTEEIQKELAELEVEWAVIDGVHLERVFEFENYREAIAFVDKVAEVAEKQNHHPDMHVSYAKVIVQITTHSAFVPAGIGVASELDSSNSEAVLSGEGVAVATSPSEKQLKDGLANSEVAAMPGGTNTGITKKDFEIAKSIEEL